MEKWIIFSVCSTAWGVLVYWYFQKGNFSLKKSTTSAVVTASNPISSRDRDIIAVAPQKIRIIFDAPDIDYKELADFTVKLSDLKTGNYHLPEEIPRKILSSPEENPIVLPEDLPTLMERITEEKKIINEEILQSQTTLKEIPKGIVSVFDIFKKRHFQEGIPSVADFDEIPVEEPDEEF